MKYKNWTVNSFNEKSGNLISSALMESKINKGLPIICCIGSDLVIGDSLGPLVGTMLKNQNLNTYIYGTLDFPLTAKEMPYLSKYLKNTHPNQEIIAIDAAIGSIDDVGLIKIANVGVMPGLGVKKKLGIIGTKSIIGIVAEKSLKNNKLFNATRLNLVYKMAEHISNGIIEYVNNIEKDSLYSFDYVFSSSIN